MMSPQKSLKRTLKDLKKVIVINEPGLKLKKPHSVQSEAVKFPCRTRTGDLTISKTVALPTELMGHRMQH